MKGKMYDQLEDSIMLDVITWFDTPFFLSQNNTAV